MLARQFEIDSSALQIIQSDVLQQLSRYTRPLLISRTAAAAAGLLLRSDNLDDDIDTTRGYIVGTQCLGRDTSEISYRRAVVPGALGRR